MNVRNLVISLSLGVLVLIIGIGLGVLYQGNKNPVQSQVQEQLMPDSIKVLSSKVVSSIMVIGTVAKIDGANVTLTYLSDSVTIKMASDVSVYAMVSAPVTPLNKSKYITKQETLQDIKVGDNLEVNVRVLPIGQVEGFNVIILPSANTPPAPAVKK